MSNPQTTDDLHEEKIQELLEQPKFANEHCEACIRKNFKKYNCFKIKCKGILVQESVDFAIKNGLSEEEAREIYDPIFWFEKYYGSPVRHYQKAILLCTSNNITSLQCRQTGKTLLVVYRLLHYIFTNANKTVLICTPGEKQIKSIYDRYILRDCIDKNRELRASVKTKGQKPYYYLELCNGSRMLLMIANPGARGQSCHTLYVDEAAMIQNDILSDIIMTRAAAGDESSQIQTSTPKGRDNLFYKSCKEDPTCNEFYVPITVVKEMANQVESYRNILGPAMFDQECMALFPSISDGPFNFAGIDLAKSPYSYSSCSPRPDMIYIGGVDWNGPTIGSYFTIIEFDQANYFVKVVERKVVSSSEWNSMVAKQTLIELNRKWKCSHWMVDAGYSHTLQEELRAYSMKVSQNLGSNHPDSKLKFIIDPVEFGSFIEVKDPFTKEVMQKTARSFMVSQVARLFEPYNDSVRIAFPTEDVDIVKSLENYKLLNITARGFEQYGFEKGCGIEDHLMDSLILAIYGIVKYYNELFKRIVLSSVTFGANNAFKIASEGISPEMNIAGLNTLLIADSDKTPIENDESKFIERSNHKEIYVSRAFNNRGVVRRVDQSSMNGIRKTRTGIIKRGI